MDKGEGLSEIFEESYDDIFSILEALESGSDCNNSTKGNESFEFQKSVYNISSPLSGFLELEAEIELAPSSSSSPGRKRQKLSNVGPPLGLNAEEGQPRVSHITVERNRRKQMNEHLSVLQLNLQFFPCGLKCRNTLGFSKGDQASIIGGVIDYINELQQVHQSLEAKKQRKAYVDVLSPRPVISPRKPPLSPRTPQPSSPYKARLHNLQPTGFSSPVELSPCNSSTSSINDSVNELVASSKSAVAEVEVKFCGPNLLLKTVSGRAPGRVVKVVSTLEELGLEILKVNINMVDEKMLNSFTIKVGIECQLSAEELAQKIQHIFQAN
ncbi:basic helix-loop-helix (bHLH) DNA-bindingsuperfamily protein [Striga asiatica]|uniref:Basic helix-loop-helix (BHLH) DNA-bindingsuperfamily protein n=1 Tax=Striga asiatica TaxID=4170 RepID=A0A5A7PN61_STRAF|nr:basic helix-loop-helix (bHLH) DNA-bindingsuperfamily protein [Striga asiatica]